MRLCRECGERMCKCFEVVLVPGVEKDVKFSLMYEWGHIYLATNYDLSFAVVNACRKS